MFHVTPSRIAKAMAYLLACGRTIDVPTAAVVVNRLLDRPPYPFGCGQSAADFIICELWNNGAVR